ncbi:STE family protein kinase [Histomonas meleagridis]|uniref:STE family protein kinase n=1 Tax=Histomonas meleagridis TaxID=135588 RepID=UPI00355ABBF5|nr:STE family protein kinase [Histomonas meleagridis]KAH0801134.1 STE family protein kinase [Histomonas meleagridis]
MEDYNVDPSGRFKREEVIVRSGIQVSYRAIDQNEGILCLWNEIYIEGSTENGFNNLIQIVNFIGSNSHPNLIALYRAWIDKTRKVFIYITELFSLQTIRSYVAEVVHSPSRSAIGNWCSQIIDGLEHYHSRNPPLIHGDICCNNIYIDSSDGIVKLGPPNLEMLLFGTPPETSAPEVKSIITDPKSDIWQIGLSVLEISTGVEPYNEYSSPMTKRNAILEGIMPQAISDVSDPIIADFITTCLLPVDHRPTLSQLREHVLISENMNANGARSMRDMGSVIQNSNSNVTPELVMQSPEFTALIERQNREKQELLMKQKQERKEKRDSIRSVTKKKQSLRELLNEVPSSS